MNSPLVRRISEIAHLAFSPVFRVSWLVLGLSILATVLAWRFFVVSIDSTAQATFDEVLLAFSGELERSITAYEQVLTGVSALVQTRPTLTRQEFRNYLAAVNIENKYPGIQGVGYAVMVPASGLEELEASIRNEGFQDFRVRPAGPRDMYSAIIFLEPFNWRNQRAFGFDMYSEPVRREAMNRARDNGVPAASGTVLLVQETAEDTQAGFLLYLPIYNQFGTPDSVEVRRQSIKGYVYSPFRLEDLISAVLSRERQMIEQKANIQIVASVLGGDPTVVFASGSEGSGGKQEAKFVQQGIFEFHGKKWDIIFASTDVFESGVDYSPAWIALVVGLTLSSLLSGLVASAALRQRESIISKERMELLSRELAHRVKNSLAVVQSIASRSLVDGRPLSEARDIFSQRLHALARAHTHLVENSWRGVSIMDLAYDELKPFGARASLQGPDIPINANTAQMFALVVHELATNAVKHGSLSTDSGRVALRWQVAGEKGNETLSFRWKETGGPPVKKPSSSGFGQKLLKQPIAHGAGGGPKITYDEDGFRYEFEVPLASIQGSNLVNGS